MDCLHGRQDDTDRILDTMEAAAHLSRRPQTLRRWRMVGAGPRYIRMGRGLRARVGYRRSDLDAWCKARTFKSTAEESAMVGAER